MMEILANLNILSLRCRLYAWVDQSINEGICQQSVRLHTHGPNVPNAVGFFTNLINNPIKKTLYLCDN